MLAFITNKFQYRDTKIRPNNMLVKNAFEFVIALLCIAFTCDCDCDYVDDDDDDGVNFLFDFQNTCILCIYETRFFKPPRPKFS